MGGESNRPRRRVVHARVEREGTPAAAFPVILRINWLLVKSVERGKFVFDPITV